MAKITPEDIAPEAVEYKFVGGPLRGNHVLLRDAPALYPASEYNHGEHSIVHYTLDGETYRLAEVADDGSLAPKPKRVRPSRAKKPEPEAQPDLSVVAEAEDATAGEPDEDAAG